MLKIEYRPVGQSWKIKTPGSYGYSVKALLPNSRHRDFKISVFRLNPYGAPGFNQLYFLTKQDADAWIENHRQLLEQTDTGWYSHSSRNDAQLILCPLEDGSEVWLRIENFP